MPIYEYRCRDCGEALEVRQAFTDEALTECPNCTGSLRKIFSTPGISFKGSGFYKTDSRSGGSGSSSGSSSTTSTSTNGDSSKSTSSDSSGSDSSSSSDSGSSKKGSSAEGPSKAPSKSSAGASSSD